MLATDPLSLLFVACIIFAGVFLILSSVLGIGHGHLLHVGHAGHIGHVGHISHVGHVAHPAHAGHIAHTSTSTTATAQPAGQSAQTTSQVSHASQGQPTSAAPAATSPWQPLSTALLGVLSLNGLLIFLLIFGLAGYLLHNATRTPALLAIVLPLLLAVACAVAVSSLFRGIFEANQFGELTAEEARIEGQLGEVSMAIRPDGLGEVVFSRPGLGRQSVGARAQDDEAIPTGAQVVILRYDEGVATVQTWERFLAATRPARLSAPPPGQPRE
jgi:hypothetical protein